MAAGSPWLVNANTFDQSLNLRHHHHTLFFSSNRHITIKLNQYMPADHTSWLFSLVWPNTSAPQSYLTSPLIDSNRACCSEWSWPSRLVQFSLHQIHWVLDLILWSRIWSSKSLWSKQNHQTQYALQSSQRYYMRPKLMNLRNRFQRWKRGYNKKKAGKQALKNLYILVSQIYMTLPTRLHLHDVIILKHLSSTGKILQDANTVDSYKIEEKGFIVCMTSKVSA